jgi:hypothetical protein
MYMNLFFPILVGASPFADARGKAAALLPTPTE